MSNLINRLTVGLACASCVLLSASVTNAQIGSLPGWRMVWSEEFRGTTVNPNNWIAESVAWPYNNELQFYLPGQATVQGGSLNITAERRSVGGRAFVSARIDTRGRFSQQYGRFEARMKLPLGQGYWPAFWLLPTSEGWPPEIDIMEHIGSQPNTVLMTQHWGTVATHQYAGGTFTGPDFTAGYHQFAAEWSPSRVDWFVDGILRHSTTTNVPQEPMYVLLNLAIGGDLPGNPTPATVFPGSMLVDWVRVYQRDQPLGNPGFEDPATGGGLTQWQVFGNAQQSSLVPRSGSKGLRISGIAGSGPYYAGVFQDLPASPGQVWQASAHARNPSDTRLVAGNRVVLKIEWYNSANAPLGVAEVTAVSDTSPTNTYIPSSLQATAPPGTAKARIALVFVQTGTGTGAAHFDDLSFGFVSPTAVPACLADFDDSGTPTADDIFAFLDQWFAQSGQTGTNLTADFDASGTVSADDIFAFLDAWFVGCP